MRKKKLVANVSKKSTFVSRIDILPGYHYSSVKIVIDGGIKIMVLFIRIDEIVQATPLPEVRLILQSCAEREGR